MVNKNESSFSDVQKENKSVKHVQLKSKKFRRDWNGKFRKISS
jgi:hypothetical protein